MVSAMRWPTVIESPTGTPSNRGSASATFRGTLNLITANLSFSFSGRHIDTPAGDLRQGVDTQNFRADRKEMAIATTTRREIESQPDHCRAACRFAWKGRFSYRSRDWAWTTWARTIGRSG